MSIKDSLKVTIDCKLPLYAMGLSDTVWAINKTHDPSVELLH